MVPAAAGIIYIMPRMRSREGDCQRGAGVLWEEADGVRQGLRGAEEAVHCQHKSHWHTLHC